MSELYDMSDDELEAAFKEAKASEGTEDTQYEEDYASEDVQNDSGETEDFADIEEDEEDSTNNPEQPVVDDQDSDDYDASTEGNAEEDSEENVDETAKETPDGETEVDEDVTTEDDEEAEDEVQPEQTYKFKANGKEYEFTESEIKDKFPSMFGQAMDYTKKLQTIKPWRKTIDALEEAKLTHEDLSLFIDARKGDKEAIAELLKQTGVDALDLDLENSTYVAKDYGRDENALAIKDIVDDISRDSEYEKTHNILTKDWDNKSWGEMSQNPETIKLLHVDVKSGMYDKIQPMAEKLKVYDGGKESDLDYYKSAAKQYFGQVEQQEAEQARRSQQSAAREAAQAKQQVEQDKLSQVKASQAKRAATADASAKRKAAVPSSGKVSNRGIVDYLDASDEEFQEWYDKAMD